MITTAYIVVFGSGFDRPATRRRRDVEEGIDFDDPYMGYLIVQYTNGSSFDIAGKVVRYEDGSVVSDAEANIDSLDSALAIMQHLSSAYTTLLIACTHRELAGVIRSYLDGSLTTGHELHPKLQSLLTGLEEFGAWELYVLNGTENLSDVLCGNLNRSPSVRYRSWKENRYS